MDDADAYMALVTSNTQSELNALERGLHALGATRKGKHGKSVAAYAEMTGRSARTVANEVAAAKVAQSLPSMANLQNCTTQLLQLHAAPRWLWPTLVEKMLADGWSVDVARKQAQRFADLNPPPLASTPPSRLH